MNEESRGKNISTLALNRELRRRIDTHRSVVTKNNRNQTVDPDYNPNTEHDELIIVNDDESSSSEDPNNVTTKDKVFSIDTKFLMPANKKKNILSDIQLVASSSSYDETDDNRGVSPLNDDVAIIVSEISEGV
ncbi:hypothetical protein JTB14_018093 [Gonioctena quinquepunctata]|nr:hypothetical protein JTB14_018093 [Gonioctena quinquepunctata]